MWEDLSTACPIGHVLKAKEDRVVRDREAEGHWMTLREIANIPDVAESILQDNDQLAKLITLRQSTHGCAFREWFHENCRSNAVETGREYANLLKQSGLLEGKMTRVMRFLASTAVGLQFGDISGISAAAADSFVIDRLIKRPSAKIFLRRLEQFEPLSPHN